MSPTTKTLLTMAAVLPWHLTSFSQLDEKFSDGDFINNPTWTGSAASWVVNGSQQLQSNNTIANSTFYLSTGNNLATSVQWEFSLQLSFNTSSANYADVFLTASGGDLSSNSTTGYFVRIGNTDDEVALYRKDAGGAVVKIIDGLNGVTNSSDNKLKIKIVRNAANEFTLYRNLNNSSYVTEGSVIDNTYSTSSYFGLLIRQSTSSFFQKHFFDDISIQPYAPDIAPPFLQSVTATSANTLDVLFSEPVDATSSQTATNYSANNNIGNPATATLDAGNNALVHLSFANNFPNGATHTLTVNTVQDLAGNIMSAASATFSFYTAQRFDVLIDEIMADPTPKVGLPEVEYIELKNVSGRPINLQGWRLATATSTSGSFPNYVLAADSFLIIASSSSAPLLAGFGNALAVGSFPSLNNDSSRIMLTSKENKIIHSVHYSSDWYANTVKKEGGWSLEMIDTHYPCTGNNNWKACANNAGGTPGNKNSVDAVNKDSKAPVLQQAYVVDSLTIILSFDETTDSLSACDKAHYSLTPSIALASAQLIDAGFLQVQLKLATPLNTSTVYHLTATDVIDCAGNKTNSATSIKIGVPHQAASGDIVINEILFNPRPDAYDYIELYNRSNKIIDANKLFITNRNSAGVPGSLKKVSEKPSYIFPGDYAVLCPDLPSLQLNYLVKNAEVVFKTDLPSLPDDEGTAVLLNVQGDVVDEVHYKDDWHFALISNAEGVSLERIDPEAGSPIKSNWHSAASTAGYGTPGYKNSQYKQTENINAVVETSPKTFSPDNDGFEDIATINYQLNESGYLANITIFDANGRLVRHLAKNALLGLRGSWHWDGLNEKGQKLPIGTYIIYTEIFNLQGKKKQFKNTVVLARRMY